MSDGGALTGRCHCGAVTITLAHPPEKILQCNCSLCTRLGWVGSYYQLQSVVVEAAPDTMQFYVQGREWIDLWRCKKCGCTTHWTARDDGGASPDYMGVNMRIFPVDQWCDIESVSIDGASI